MTEETGRAAALRERAAELLQTIKGMPDGKQQDAMVRYRALLGLAEVEDWVAVKPHQPANHDYKLSPKSVRPPTPARPMRRGRKVRGGE